MSLTASAPEHVPATRLDLRGETCPVPLIEARKALRAVPVGGRVELVGDHDSSFAELPLLAANLGHGLVLREGDPTGWRIVLERRR